MFVNPSLLRTSFLAPGLSIAEQAKLYEGHELNLGNQMQIKWESSRVRRNSGHFIYLGFWIDETEMNFDISHQIKV